MASKSRKRSKRRAAVNYLDLVQRNFQRGDFKQALKDARVGYREDATPQLRSLLEHVYLARAEQLSRQGLRDDSRRILQELLDLGVTEPAVQAGLPDVLLTAGMLDRLPAGRDALSDNEQERLHIRIVDRAVVQPDDAPQDLTDVRENAQRVRIALEAVERGDEASAAEQLNGIPRQSPFADWKFFVRGLMAYYREDKEAMSANWQRLDEDRAAFRIAAPLRCMAGVATAPKGSRLADQVARLETQATSRRVLGSLKKLDAVIAKHQWRQALKVLQAVGSELRRHDADCYRRVVAWLSSVLIREGEVEAVDRLATFAQPPTFDPRWNRARAAVREHADQWGAEQYWLEYLGNLEHAASISTSERGLIRAMVHLHLSRAYVRETLGLRNCSCGADHSSEIEEAEASALRHMDQCVTLAPTYRVGYVRLAEFHEDCDRLDAAADVYRRWLEQEPNDADALLLLGGQYLALDQPLEAREVLERARRAKPLDAKLGDLLWLVDVKCARHLACRGEWDAARDEMSAADRLKPDRKDDYDVLAIRAALETKAGRPHLARAYLEQAQESLSEPTALWMAMAIESTRFELPNKETWLYEKRWQTALKRRCRSETAGQMCSLLRLQLQSPRPYEGIDEHVQIVLKYLRRCSRVKWQAADLRYVCDFLCAAKEMQLLETFVKRGLKRFSQQAFLPCFAAMVEVAKGAWDCDREKALDYANEAIRLGSLSDDPADKSIVEAAKKAQTLIDEVCDDYYDDDCDDDFAYDDDEDDAEDDDRGMDDILDEIEDLPPGALAAMIRAFCKRSGMDPKPLIAEFERRRAARKRSRN